MFVLFGWQCQLSADDSSNSSGIFQYFGLFSRSLKFVVLRARLSQFSLALLPKSQ
jgi:hypothetical protein